MQPHSEESSSLSLHWDALFPWTALGWEKLVNEPDDSVWMNGEGLWGDVFYPAGGQCFLRKRGRRLLLHLNGVP